MKRKVLLLSCVFLTGACADEHPTRTEGSPSGPPGSTAWYDDITCERHDDCDAGEVCIDNSCQIQLCAEKSYSSSPPLGKTMHFRVDRELIVARGGSDASRIEAYEPLGDTFASPDHSAIWAEGAAPNDLAGGNFLGRHPEVVALVQDGKNSVRFVGENVDQQMALSIQPNRIAAGDIDQDGVMEVGVASRTGDFEICSAVTGTCSHAGSFGNMTGFDLVVEDVAMADVDADGQAELLFVGRQSSSNSNFVIGVYNPDHAKSGQPQLIQTRQDGEGRGISAADLDGDRIAEIFVINHGRWKDKIQQLQVADGAITNVASVDLDGKGIDILASDIDSDDRAEVMVLTDNDRVEVYTRAGAASLHRSFTTGLSMTEQATRLAMVDRDSDSTYGELMQGPKLVPGELVPMAVTLYPPYSREFSEGTATAAVGGRGYTMGTKSESVSLSSAMWVEFVANVQDVLRGKVAAKIAETVEWNTSVSKKTKVYEWFQMIASPEVEGLYTAGVMFGCGCFHSYKYRVRNPKGEMSDLGETMDVYVPVGGQTHIMSTARYNAMAKATGKMPVINVPYRVGDVSSYPSTPETLDGEIIYKDDVVFEPRLYRVSDSSLTGWRNYMGETNASSVTRTVNARAYAEADFAIQIPTLGVGGGVNVGGAKGIGTGVGYTITVSDAALFDGEVPPLPDDPKTPEDEYVLHAYGFTPLVYRHRYTTPSGDESGYFVQTFAVPP